MDFVSQLGNSVVYNLHQATYNPEAEAYSKEKADKAAAEKEEKDAAALKAKQEKEAAEAVAKEKAAAAEKESLKTFSASRLFFRIVKYGFYVLLLIGLLAASFYGASYATNLNVYQTFQGRLWCAIYGFLFGIPVTAYAFYRWFNGHVDPYFSILPLFKAEETSLTVRNNFAFLLFDETPNQSKIASLKEWESTTPA
jgi:hypothetical protein